MKGNEKVIQFLNTPLLAEEYAAIQQYEFHRAVAKNLGLKKYAKYLKERIKDEMWHAKMLRDKILFLGGTPIVKPSEISISMDIPEQLAEDLLSETQAEEHYNDGVKLAMEEGDDDTAHLLRHNLKDETDHINDIDAFLAQIKLMGIETWISEQV